MFSLVRLEITSCEKGKWYENWKAVSFWCFHEGCAQCLQNRRSFTTICSNKSPTNNKPSKLDSFFHRPQQVTMSAQILSPSWCSTFPGKFFQLRNSFLLSSIRKGAPEGPSQQLHFSSTIHTEKCSAEIVFVSFTAFAGWSSSRVPFSFILRRHLDQKVSLLLIFFCCNTFPTFARR